MMKKPERVKSQPQTKQTLKEKGTLNGGGGFPTREGALGNTEPGAICGGFGGRHGNGGPTFAGEAGDVEVSGLDSQHLALADLPALEASDDPLGRRRASVKHCGRDGAASEPRVFARTHLGPRPTSAALPLPLCAYGWPFFFFILAKLKHPKSAPQEEGLCGHDGSEHAGGHKGD